MRDQKPEFIDFGRRLRELRKARDLSQEKLAELSGLERTYISQAEQGRRNTTLSTMQKLAAGLGIAPSELLLPPATGPQRPERHERG